jgi:hypothetical protein
MVRIYVCSPLSAPTREGVLANMKLARDLCLYAMLIEDVAAYAPHAWLPEILDDGSTEERMLGMEAGQAWLEAAEGLWVFTKRGISQGMAREIEIAARRGVPVTWDPSCWRGVGES